MTLETVRFEAIGYFLCYLGTSSLIAYNLSISGLVPFLWETILRLAGEILLIICYLSLKGVIKLVVLLRASGDGTFGTIFCACSGVLVPLLLIFDCKKLLATSKDAEARINYASIWLLSAASTTIFCGEGGFNCFIGLLEQDERAPAAGDFYYVVWAVSNFTIFIMFCNCYIELLPLDGS